VGLFDRKKQQGAVPAPSATDWSKIENIRAEWPQSSLDRAADLQKYQHALALFERDDYPAMMQAATLFAAALAHSLYGEGILQGSELPETVHRTLYCSLCAPPDRKTFADTAQKAARLALTIMRENGWQPASMGGLRPVSEPMIMDTGNYMLLGSALAPAGQPQLGDLRAFFDVPPTRAVAAPSDAKVTLGEETVNRLYGVLRESRAGDSASTLFMDGMALAARGDGEGALAKFSEAATLGSADAMVSAGEVTGDMGRLDESRFWYERAGNAGHAVGMFNSAIAAIQRGDRATAVQWFQKSAQAGNAEGFAALTQLAAEAGDEAAEARWSRLGAEAGHTFCMARHGLLLAMHANEDVPSLRRARDLVEQAAERGDSDSMSLAVDLNHQLGDSTRARRFADMVVRGGNAEEIDRLRRYGYL
jgi:hypothetical protein